MVVSEISSDLQFLYDFVGAVASPGPSGNSGLLNVEAILGTEGGFPAIDVLQPDTDDETMVELAIALSLQVGFVQCGNVF